MSKFGKIGKKAGRATGKEMGNFIGAMIFEDLKQWKQDNYNNWSKREKEAWLLETAWLDPVQPKWVRQARRRLYENGRL